MTRPATPTATPPRLGALISEALDAVHAHATAVAQCRADQAAALLESSRAQDRMWRRLHDVAPEEFVVGSCAIGEGTR